MSDSMHIYLDEVGDLQLNRASKVLAGIPAGVQKAVGSALKRAAQHGLTVGMKYAAMRYVIGENELKRNTRNINTIVRDNGGSYEVTFGYRGNLIPLIRFDTAVGRDGGVSARVLRSSARQASDRAFIATMGGHTGIFERTGPKRYPVEERYGPSAVHALDDTSGTKGTGLTEKFLEDEIYKTYEKRIDHEILRVLNGWGG